MPSHLCSTFPGGRMHHRLWSQLGAQETALAGQVEGEEGWDGSRDLRHATAAELEAAAHSQVGGLVRATNPSSNSGMRAKTENTHAIYM